jgi:DnaK suppressor protein
MPNDRELAKFRKQLLQYRRRIIDTHRSTNRDLEEIQDAPKDPEFEETAQSSLTEFTLRQLTDVQRHELLEVDGALARMDAGEYGDCEDCGSRIAPARLRAIPYARLCAECATAQETEKRGLGTLAAPGTL